MGMNAISIALFNHRSKAEPLRRRLNEAGFPAEIHEHAGMSRIEVPGDQFERAYELLLNWDDAEGALRETIRCPECRSLRIEYPQYNLHESVLPNLAMGLLANIGAMKKEFYCHDCHCMWHKESKDLSPGTTTQGAATR